MYVQYAWVDRIGQQKESSFQASFPPSSSLSSSISTRMLYLSSSILTSWPYSAPSKGQSRSFGKTGERKTGGWCECGRRAAQRRCPWCVRSRETVRRGHGTEDAKAPGKEPPPRLRLLLKHQRDRTT